GNELSLTADEGAEPRARALQVLHDGDRPTPGGLAFTNRLDHCGVRGMRAMGEVEPGHVHAGRHQPIQCRPAGGRRADSADNLGPSHPSAFRRYCPVYDRCACCTTSSGVPVATTRPPSLPPSGPRSTIQSAVLITSMLCSMITTVLPCSTSWFSTSSSLRMSAKWRPVVGSSRM